MKNLVRNHNLVLVGAFWLFILFALSSCSTSRSTYGNSGSHGWNTDRKCGKKKPGKWQRTSSYDTNRDGSTNCSAWW